MCVRAQVWLQLVGLCCKREWFYRDNLGDMRKWAMLVWFRELVFRSLVSMVDF